MAHSIQKLDDRVEIFNDLDLIALVGLFSEQVQQQPEKFRSLYAIAQRWIDDLAGYGPGVIDLGLDMISASDAVVNEFQVLVSVVEDRLSGLEPAVPASVLNARCRASGVTFGDFPVDPLRDALGKLRAFVVGERGAGR